MVGGCFSVFCVTVCFVVDFLVEDKSGDFEENFSSFRQTKYKKSSEHLIPSFPVFLLSSDPARSMR